MEVTVRRSSRRLQSFLFFVVLSAFAASSLSLSGAQAAAGHLPLHRRDTLGLHLRQEEPEPSDVLSSTEVLPEPSSSSILSSTTSAPVSSSSSIAPSTSRIPSTTRVSSSTTRSSRIPPSTTTPSSTRSPSSSATVSSSATSSSIVASSSESSSLSVPSSISSGSSSLVASSTPVFDRTIATQLTVTNDIFTDRPFTTPPAGEVDDSNGHSDDDSDVDAVGGASKGFWANKGAVAATFVVVSIVILGIGAFVASVLWKKRNRARQSQLRRELFGEKYGSDGGTTPGGSAHGHSSALSDSSHKDVVYDDSRFKGATVTSDYPFAVTSAAVSSQRYPETQTRTPPQSYPQPPNSSHSHSSQQTKYWTPNESQQSLSTQQHHSNGTQQPSQYLLLSQAQAQQNRALVDANAVHYGQAGYYASNQYTSYATPGSVDGYSTQVPVASQNAPPVSFRYPTGQAQRDSIDSFYGNYGKQSPAPSSNVRA